jgi:uncharacterized protein (DUF1330 family)
MVAEVKKKDKVKYNQYIAEMSSFIAEYGGRFLVRGGRMVSLFRGLELERRRRDKILILEFPTAADLTRCFTSTEYQALVPLRDASAEIQATLLEGYDPER